jgi:hypothetical protein
MKNLKSKFFIWFILTILLVGISYGYYYFEQLSDTYISDNLQDININLLIEWNDEPYSINHVFKSRDNYIVSQSITWKNINLIISWVSKQWYIWFNIIWNSWETSSYILNVKPNQNFLDNDKVNYKVTPKISGFTNWSFNIDLTDNEINDNLVKPTWLNFKSNLISYDWEYFFSLNSWKIEKFWKNFHHLNTYDIDLWDTWLFINNVTDLKCIKDNIYLRFNNWKILHWTKVGDKYSFIDSWNTYSDIWLSNNTIVSPLFLNWISWVRDYEKIWNFLYVLTDTEFKVYYTVWWMNNLSLIYSQLNQNNLQSFIVDKWVFLFNSVWDLFVLNNDFQIYYLKDENNVNQWFSTSKTFDSYKPNLSIQWDKIAISNILLTSPVDSVINWYKYASEWWIPVYNKKELWIILNSNDFTKLKITKNLIIDKFSSNYWTIIWDLFSTDINIPIIWYWVSFSYKWMWENVSPKLNVWVLDTITKKFNINEWEVYLHIKAYDYWMNSSDELIKWPIIVRNSNPKISTPYINTNLVNIDWWDTVKFIFKSDKKLSSALITIEDDLWNISTFTLADLDYTEVYDWFSYIITYSIVWWTNQLKFNIEWVDLWWNKSSVYYEYNLNSWWFQVLWVSQTNSWLWANLSKNQKEKWFIYWVSSKSLVSNEINTDYKFNVNDNNFIYIPTEIDDNWNSSVNHSLLKSNFKVFSWKAKKEIDDNFFFEWWDKSKPIKNIKLLNWYYYFYNWNLQIDEMIFSWNWILLVNGDLDIRGDVIKDLTSETEKYPNNLKIYVTWNINVYSNATKIDSYLFTNNRLTTLSVAYDLENNWDTNFDNIFKNIDWKIYYDLTSDWKVDLITYENIPNNKKVYNIYIMWDNNKYTLNKLTNSWWLTGDSINYNTTSTNIINWKLVKDIVITNWGINTTYFINQSINWLIQQ